MRRLAAFAVAASLLLSWAGRAMAAGDCPDGDWFCDPAPPPEPAPPAPAPARPTAPAPRPPPPPPPPPPYLLPPPPPGYYYYYSEPARLEEPPAPPPSRGYHEFGVNLHAVIGLMGDDPSKSPNAGMNGVGGAFRYRPIPYVAIEAAPELVWGTDYNGYQRFEDALLLNGLFFANPFTPLQLYGIAGLGLGAAFLDAGSSSSSRPPLRDDTYLYFSMQLGAGLEARLSRHFALGADFVGFLRWRFDQAAGQNPEFVDRQTGRTTNTSSGCVIRLGATFYW